MNVRVAASAPVTPPETGASSIAGLLLSQPGKGSTSGCSAACAAASATRWLVGGSIVLQSMSSGARTCTVNLTLSKR